MRNYQDTGQDNPSGCATNHIDFETPDRTVRGGERLREFSEETIMFEPLTRRLHAWHMRNFTRRKLSMLDDRILADLGIERGGIGDFVARLDSQGDRP